MYQTISQILKTMMNVNALYFYLNYWAFTDGLNIYILTKRGLSNMWPHRICRRWQYQGSCQK